MRTPWTSVTALVVTATTLAGCSAEHATVGPLLDTPPAMAAGAKAISSLPAAVDKACRNGRAKLNDECCDQRALLAAAKARAAAEKKVLLVAYGAEWCIWCHVFTQHIEGRTGAFRYTYGSPEAPDTRTTSTLEERAKRDVVVDARALTDFVAAHFVVVHIDAQHAPNGKAVISDGTVKVRRDTADWYRGYDRAKLLVEPKRMHAATL